MASTARKPLLPRLRSLSARVCDLCFGGRNRAAAAEAAAAAASRAPADGDTRWTHRGGVHLGGNREVQVFLHRTWWGGAHIHTYPSTRKETPPLAPE
jgi:hypothetical protein